MKKISPLLLFSIVLNLTLIATALWLWKRYEQVSPGWTIFSSEHAKISDARPFPPKLCREKEFHLPNHPTSPDLLLLGDSLIAMGRWENYFPGKSVINHGVPGDTTDCVWYRLHRTLELKPKRIVLLIGINDLAQGRSVETTASFHYRLLVAIRQALPDAKLYVLSCLPVDKRPELPGSVNIASLNQFIEKAAKENGAVYIDAYSALASASILNDEFDLGDGIHLNEKAYSKLAETLAAAW